MLNPNECKHEHTRKAGIVLQSGKKRQRLQCLECGKLINDGEIIENVRPAAKKNAHNQNHEPVKAGDSR